MEEELEPQVPKEKKARKPLSEETLAKLAQAREKANQKRKEMAEQRKADKEALVQEKLEQAKTVKDEKLEKAAAKEAKKRMYTKAAQPVQDVEPMSPLESLAQAPKPKKKPKDTVVVEYSSSDSDDFDFKDARVMFVKKDRPKPQAVQHDPLAGAYSQMFGAPF